MSGTPIQATAVALDGRGLLITGASGAGKSALALDLIAMGGALIADDLVLLSADEGRLFADAPRQRGLIEARGIGLLEVRHTDGRHGVDLALDLDTESADRLPQARRIAHLGVSIPLIGRPAWLQPAAIAAVLRAGGPVDPQGFL